MSSTKSETQRQPAKTAPLAKQYGAIGPAAIVAALMFAKKNKAPMLAGATKAA